MAAKGEDEENLDSIKDSSPVDGKPESPSVGIGGTATTQEPGIDIPTKNDSYEEKTSLGIVFVINQKKFDENKYRNLSPRHGTDVDRDSIIATLLAIGFLLKNIIVLNDPTKEEIEKQIQLLRKRDHSNSYCFMCFILTHGFENGILCAYDKPYSDGNIFKNFEGDRCPTLRGKPKLFFIQACGGSKLDAGCCINIEQTDGDVFVPKRIPTTSDFLIHRSTVPGYYSWRNVIEGSWFIQALTSVLNESLKSNQPDDLLSLLTVVNRKVAYEKMSTHSDPDFDGKKEQPSVYHTLTRKVYLCSTASNVENDV